MSELSTRDRVHPTRRVAVVGGGVSGLAAAQRVIALAKEVDVEIDVTVLDAAERPGGVVRTERHEGCLLEAGADSLVPQKPAAAELCREIGLGDELVEIDAHPGSLQVVHARRLHRLPAGFLLFVPTRLGSLLGSSLFSLPGKVRIALEALAGRQRARGDESLRSFVERRLGSELYERVAEPIVAGLFVADGDRFSADMALPRLRTIEQRFGSLTRGMLRARAAAGRGHGTASFLALRGGMQRIVEGLVGTLPIGCVRGGSRVTGIARQRAGGYSIEIDGRAPLAADAVVLACPAFELGRLLDPIEPGLGSDVAELDYASVVTVHLAYPRTPTGPGLAGHGFFVPRTEGMPILACTHVGAKFPGRTTDDVTVLRAYLGGALDPGMIDRRDDELIDLAHRSLAAMLDIRQAPLWNRVHRFPRAMPQYPIGYRDRLTRLNDRLGGIAGLELCGGVTGAVGLPDCIESARRAASRTIQHLTPDSVKLPLAI